jgi:hypothetical protein
MRSTRVLGLAVLLSLLATLAWAADVTGTWKAQIPGRDGTPSETTFTFKVAGATLTGTVTTPRGESAISDGKIDGDNISFVVIRKFQDKEMKMTYKGAVAGNEIKFTVVREGSDRTQEFVAKKG